MIHPVSRWFIAILVFLVSGSLLTGCDLLGKSGPEEAKLNIQGEAGEELRLITSALFLTDRIQDIRDDGSVIDSLSILLITADTSIITLPFDSTYDISSEQRFYVRLNRFGSSGDDNMFVRIWVDDELKFERQPDGERDSVQFIYNFRGAPGQDNVEL